MTAITATRKVVADALGPLHKGASPRRCHDRINGVVSHCCFELVEHDDAITACTYDRDTGLYHITFVDEHEATMWCLRFR